jgi:hypothetical protein
MSFVQPPPAVPTFDPSSPAPPPYTSQPVQLPTPTPAPTMNPFGTPPIQSGYPQGHMQPQLQSQQPPLQTGYPQAQYIQSPQPMQQPFQGVPNMTPQQVQQVQQVMHGYPPEKVQMVQQLQQISPPPPQMTGQQPQQPIFQQTPPIQQPAAKPHYTTTAPSGLFGSKKSSPHSTGPQDAQKSDSVKRFFGDTLVGRVARSSVQTATSITKMPTSLSPWGDSMCQSPIPHMGQQLTPYLATYQIIP